jgi:HEPN domain-containing protein
VFFAQQCIEKYIKARLLEADIYFKKTHDLTYLIGLVAEVVPLWIAYEQEFRLVTDYGVSSLQKTCSKFVKVSALSRAIVWD